MAVDCGGFCGNSKSEPTTSNTATDRRFACERTWLYFSIIFGDIQPSSAWRVWSVAPPAAMREAALCRKSCHLHSTRANFFAVCHAVEKEPTEAGLEMSGKAPPRRGKSLSFPAARSFHAESRHGSAVHPGIGFASSEESGPPSQTDKPDGLRRQPSCSCRL